MRADEWEEMAPQRLYVSATPADYELEKSAGVVVEQVIRPTGLLDPKVEVRPAGKLATPQSDGSFSIEDPWR